MLDRIEFPHLGQETGKATDRWRDALEEGSKTIKEFEIRQADLPRTRDTERAIQQFRSAFRTEQLPGTMMLECYPAEFMTEREMECSTGIVW